jgi:hypothetical protein
VPAFVGPSAGLRAPGDPGPFVRPRVQGRMLTGNHIHSSIKSLNVFINEVVVYEDV